MKINTICRLCSACCPVEVSIENGRLVSVQRVKRYPDSIHQVCPKAQAAAEIIYSSKRLNKPKMRTKEGTLQDISWETAFDFICFKMKEIKENYGAEALGWLRGQASDWGGPWQYVMRLMHAFGSPNAIGNGSVCHAGREALQTFTYGDMSSPDYKNSKCIICWGRNDQDTNPTAYEDLLYARSKGAKLVVIDPVKTPLATKADIWLQIKPGTDGFLAMAMMNWIIKNDLFDHEFVKNYTVGFNFLKKEVEDYSPEKISKVVQIPTDKMIKAVKLYTNNRPACIGEGNGLDMHCQVSQVTRALAILRAISGNLDRRGGDLIPQPVKIKNYQLRTSFWKEPTPISIEYPLFSQYSEKRGIHAMGVLTDAILEEKPYPIKGLIIQGANPIVTMANVNRVKKAFRKLNFLAVIDPMMTQTAEFADIILPASFSFEQTMISNNALSGNNLRLQKKVIEPWEKSLPDWEIIFRIAQRLGFEKEFPWKSVEEAIDDQLQPSGITVKELNKSPEGISLEKVRYQKYLQEGFKTPSKKVEIESSLLKKYGYPAIPEFWDSFSYQGPSFYEKRDHYPLIGLSGRRSNNFVHSQFRHIKSLREKGSNPIVDIHPQDAKERNINQDDSIIISTPNGSIKIRAGISSIVVPGTVRIAWGWGEYSEKYNLNLLTDDSLKDPITSTTSNRVFMPDKKD